MEEFAKMFFYGMRYEQWLRFHYMDDAPGREDAAMIAVPPQAAGRSLQEEPELSSLLKALDGREVSLERTRDAIAAWAAAACGMAGDAGALAESMRRLTEDREFLRLMDMHNGWIQELADKEAWGAETADGHPAPSFSEWSSAFYRWLAERDASCAGVPGSTEQTTTREQTWKIL